MADIRFDFNRLGNMGPRSKATTALIVVAAVSMFLVDTVALKGEIVAREVVRFDTPGQLAIERVGEKHTLEIETRRRVRGENRGRTIQWRLEDPEGVVVYESAELTSHTRRFYTFRPVEAGTYTIHVEDNGMLFQSDRGSATVNVLVNDRRIFARLFAG